MTIVQTNMTMMMPSFTSSILVIVILLCLQQQFVTVAAGGSGTSNTGSDDICSYDYEINCQGGSPYAAITSVTLASAVSSGGGEAYVTFHWGQTHTDTNVGSILQPMNTPQTLKESHEYYQEGEYYAGVSIVFGAGSGCNGVKLQGYKLLKFVGLSCDVIDLEHEEEVDGSLAGTTSSTLAVSQEGVVTTSPPPLISAPVASSLTCSFLYEIDCDNTIPYSATAWVTFHNPNYEASVTFHWGLDDKAIGSRIFTLSQPDIVDSFTYTKEGEYYTGYTVVFGNGSGCEGMTFQGYKLLWYDDATNSCDVFDDEPNNLSLVQPTASPPITATSTAASAPAPVSTPAEAVESNASDTSTSAASSRCAYDYEVTCNNPHSAMAYVTFVNPAYEASIAFHWDTANTVIESRYYSNTSPSMANSYDFGTEGVYTVGATIEFGEGYGCDDVIYETYHTVSFDGLACQVTESNEVDQGTSTMNNGEGGVAAIAPSTSGIVAGDWTNAPSMMKVEETMTASTVTSTSGAAVASPSSGTTPISSMTSPPATMPTTTEQESSSSSPPLSTVDVATTAVPMSSMIPTFSPVAAQEASSSVSPSAMPRSGAEPIPISKNMLTSSGVVVGTTVSSVLSIIVTISSAWIVSCILH